VWKCLNIYQSNKENYIPLQKRTEISNRELLPNIHHHHHHHHLHGMDKIIETPDNIGIKLLVLATLKEHYLGISFFIISFLYAV